MKRFSSFTHFPMIARALSLLLAPILILSQPAHATLTITDTTATYLIDFDNTVAGVNNGQWAGTGFSETPAAGQLDSTAWRIVGMSDGLVDFGGEFAASTDFGRGVSTGGVTGGGLYAFDVATGNYALGVQPTGADFNPGTITLRVQNTSGSIITGFDFGYNLWVRNDATRANSFNFSWSADDDAYTSIAGFDYTSTAAADTTPAWVVNPFATAFDDLVWLDGQFLYVRWNSQDVSGSGSRDEFALDNISFSNFDAVAPSDGLFWVGADSTRGGSGSWTATGGTSWAPIDDDVAGGAWNPDKRAVFGGDGGGTVTVTGAVTLNAGMNFTSNYNISGDILTLGGVSQLENNITVAGSMVAEISSVLAGTAGMAKTGEGTLILTSANNYTGGTSIGGGVLSLSGSGSLADTGTVVLSGVGSTFDISGISAAGETIGSLSGGVGTQIELGSKNLTVGGDNTFTTFAGNLNGAFGGGSLTKEGSGTFTLSGGIGFGGLVSINGGTLAITPTGDVSLFNDFTGVGTLRVAGGGTGTTTTELSGNLSGLTGLIEIARWSGGGGVVFLASSAPLNSGATVRVLDGATLLLGGGVTYDNLFELMGTATPISDANGQLRMQGNTEVAGPVVLKANSSIGNIDVFDAAEISGAISEDGGSHSLTKQGPGAIVLSGDNTYTGTTIVGNGVLRAGRADNAFGLNSAMQVNFNGILELDGFDNTVSALSGSGLVQNNSATQAAKLTAGSNGNDTTFSGTVQDGFGEAFAFEKVGTGTLTLTGSSFHTGGTTVSGGGLTGTTESLVGVITNNALVTFEQAADGTYGGAMSGTGQVAKSGVGEVTFANANAYQGGTTLAGGALIAAANGAFGSGVITIEDGRLLAEAGVTLANDMVVNAMGFGTTQLLAGWDFQTTDNGGTALVASPDTPTTIIANFGSGTLHLDGTNSSSSWLVASTNTEVNAFAGTFVNAGPGFDTSTTGPASLVLVNESANGKSIVFAIDMSEFGQLNISYASQRTATGFSAQQWDYSDDGGLNWNPISTLTTTELQSTFVATGTISLPQVDGLNFVDNGLVRVTFTGASSSGGNNRLDNIQFNANQTAIVSVGTESTSGTVYYEGDVTLESNVSLTAAAGARAVFSGTIEDGAISRGVVKTGEGAVELTNANSYSGGTTVSEGTLVASNSSGSATGTGSVLVEVGATLAGSGRVAPDAGEFIVINGTLHVGDPDLVTPVATVFELATSGGGAVQMQSGSFIELDLLSGAGFGDNTGNVASADIIKLFGNFDATLGGTLVLGNPNNQSSFAEGDRWALFDLSGGAILGALGIDDSALNLSSGLFGTFDSSSGVYSIAVPEPSRLLLLGLGAAGLLLRRRR